MMILPSEAKTLYIQSKRNIMMSLYPSQKLEGSDVRPGCFVSVKGMGG